MTMKLSEAIRLGAMMKPQAKGMGYGKNESGETTSCAIFAAVDAMGGFNSTLREGELVDGNARGLNSDGKAGEACFRKPKEWCAVLDHPQTCPQCGEKEWRGIYVISIHLNDLHGWTRERISDWVEEQEAKLEQSAPENWQSPAARAHEVTMKLLDILQYATVVALVGLFATLLAGVPHLRRQRIPDVVTRDGSRGG